MATPPMPRDAGRSGPAAPRIDDAVEAVWSRLCEGVSAPWLDEIGALRAEGDGLKASLDIWSVALTAALKDRDRRTTAAPILARLRRFAESS